MKKYCRLCRQRTFFSKTKLSNVTVCIRCGAKYEELADGKVIITRVPEPESFK